MDTSQDPHETDEARRAREAEDGTTLANLVGPFYTPESVSKMLGGTVGDFDLLITPTSDGKLFYPAFQFENKVPRQDILDIVAILLSGGDPWTAALWMNVPQVDDPKRRTAIELLNAGERELVEWSARDDAHRWSQ